MASLVATSDIAIICTIYGCSILFGIIGNLLLLSAFIKYSKLRQVRSNYFLFNLSMVDFLVCCMALPYAVMSLLGDMFSEDFGAPFCRVGTYLAFSLAVASILSFMMFSIDRYVAIMHPFAYNRFFSFKFITVVNLYPWIHSFSVYLPAAVFDNNFIYVGVKGALCKVNWDGQLEYTLSVTLTSLLIPYITIAAVNVAVFRTARKQQRRIDNEMKVRDQSLRSKENEERKEPQRKMVDASRYYSQKKEIKIALSTMVVIFVFFLSYIPYLLPRLVATVMKENLSIRTQLYTMCIGLCNSGWNPVITLLVRRDLRTQVYKIITCGGRSIRARDRATFVSSVSPS